MPRAKTTVSQLRVGILAVATIVILIVFILSVSGDIALFKKRVNYTTRFNAAEGLKKGDEVRLAGKLVGKVEKVNFGDIPLTKDEKPIVVSMVFDAKDVGTRIRRDSQAVLAQQGFLGDRVIDITPGTAGSDVLPPGSEIASADQAGLAQVLAGANDILVQFNTVGKQLQELMDNINQGKGTVGKLLHDDAFYVNLNRTVLEAQDLVKRVNDGQGTLATSTYAQDAGGLGGGKGGGRRSSQNADQQKEDPQKKKAAEEAYKAGLKAIPDAKQKYDPWRNTR